MFASTVDVVTDSDRSDSSPDSPNIEGEFFSWGLEDSGPLPGRELDPEPPSPSRPPTCSLSSPLSSSLPSGSLDATASHFSTTEKTRSCAVFTEPAPPFCPIRGIYRLFDLIFEQGKTGLVDKIVIAQESLQAFINTLSPGSYSSSTKVNFKRLDDLLLKPIGVYGSKTEIVRFLCEIGTVDIEMARELLVLKSDYTAAGAEPILRPGLYIIRTFIASSQEQVYIVYWPEDMTWDDNAASTVQCNRVMFMRYLSKICDQLVCLLSAEHSEAILWKDLDDDLDESSSLEDLEDVGPHQIPNFTFGKKRKVVVSQGFTINCSHLVSQPSPPETHIDPSALSPRLLYGETTQGFMTADFRPARATFEPFSHDYPNASNIRLFLEDDVVLCLSETLGDEALEALMRIGLSTRFPKESESWAERKIEIEIRFQQTHTKHNREIPVVAIQDMVRDAVIREILKAFPMLQGDMFSSSSSSAAAQAEDVLLNIFSIYPKAESIFRDTIRASNLDKGIDEGDFQSKKDRMLILLYLLRIYKGLNAIQIRSLCNDVLFVGDEKKTLGLLKSFAAEGNTNVALSEEALQGDARTYAASISDLRFLSYVKTIPTTNFLYDAAVECEESAYDCLTTQLEFLVHEIYSQILSIQREERNKQAQREIKIEEEREKELKDSRAKFVRRVEELCRESSRSHNSIHIDDLRIKKAHLYSPDFYFISGRKETWENQEIEYTVHVLRLVADQEHNLPHDLVYDPTLVLDEQVSHFYVSSENVVRYAHLLEGDRILLGLVDSQGNVMIFLDRLSRIDDAMRSRSYSKFFHRDKIGQTCLLTFDESTRVLAVYASARMQLHLFQFDEELKSLRGFGAQIVDLRPFYNVEVSITHASFVCGKGEILLVDSSVEARIFSLILLQPTTASIKLPQATRAIYSAPDGLSVVVVHDENGKRVITAYPWFELEYGYTCGISVTLPDLPVDFDTALLTSIVNRKKIQIVGLDLHTQSCRSVALDITFQNSTDFETCRNFTSQEIWAPRHDMQTVHNCLIDCHRDVWIRFPVVAPVKHQTITSSSQRRQKTLVFVTDAHRRPFSAYFCNLIFSFEKFSRKQTDHELESIAVSALPFPTWTDMCLSNPDWPVSCFRVGEWLAALLCLIPIHVAITQENKFVPLKDGVLSLDLEKSLFGADVNRIVESLTLGWYEPIFRSYWASKPVKVVSSMGEPSVGKSFTMNHLVGTSFAGSAIHTTEGVWMSVAPAEDTLIVALDCEGTGVRSSLERSDAEDRLLVILNTAISNLVLFRNNFALSRDISGLFQSFQSSSSVLDPASNPSLFQSTLVVIIKDVTNTDAMEVTREFALEFKKFLRDEQDANFVTRLHAGKLQIVPWPVIGSREFYRRFSALKQQLDQQKTSHRTAGEFLLTLKTLMAKLKANDSGAISQALAAQRASSLLAILPVALQTGYSEVVPELEPLKAFDTDLVIEAEDTEARFLLPGPDTPAADREQHFSILIGSWDQSGTRQQVDDSEWITGLVEHLTHLVDLRVAHVEEWLKSNTQRFQADNASMEELRRASNSAVIDLRASVQLCKSECDDCNLICIQSRFHEGVHGCLTSHDCIHDCTFCDKQLLAERTCGQLAGHRGDHVCHVDAHLCGKPCTLSGKEGCADECVKPIKHEGGHICSAPVHMCGQPCDLLNLKLPDRKSFTCPGICRVPINEDHTAHVCENRLCPISCQLCERLCSGSHLHGLSESENHLCGQEHLCSALCSADGICKVDTRPLSIEATSTGKHETFQYTKFTQTAKRLNCVKLIEPGAIGHDGPHIHTNEAQPFHFCETRCGSCGYLCTLPLGHTQQEHDTRHGSMSRTRWAVDGPEGSSIELGGRKFAANDDGAQMLCNLVCTSMGRHVHIDDCRGDPHDPEAVHISERIVPNPEQDKDWITHGLHWRRMGFKDPYPREDQANFAKCDALCPGPEHTVEGGGTNAQPSRCTLPMFHPDMDPAKAPPGLGYVSTDGHHFECKNPILMQQSFHVIFVVDRSRSMGCSDRQPLPGSAGIDRIVGIANNRLGAVFSALYSFWTARQAAVDRNSSLGGVRRDAYSLIFFDDEPSMSSIENDFTSSPDELLTAALKFGIHGGTDFTKALDKTQEVMTSHWSTERTPVVIFLSDGEDYVRDNVIYKMCRSASSQGRPISFHAVSFGKDSLSSTLRRMEQIALEVQNDRVNDPLHPAAADVASSYTEALDTVRLAETFLGIAESLRKPRSLLFASH